jgi:hypothetical protein
MLGAVQSGSPNVVQSVTSSGGILVVMDDPFGETVQVFMAVPDPAGVLVASTPLSIPGAPRGASACPLSGDRVLIAWSTASAVYGVVAGPTPDGSLAATAPQMLWTGASNTLSLVSSGDRVLLLMDSEALVLQPTGDGLTASPPFALMSASSVVEPEGQAVALPGNDGFMIVTGECVGNCCGSTTFCNDNGWRWSARHVSLQGIADAPVVPEAGPGFTPSSVLSTPSGVAVVWEEENIEAPGGPLHVSLLRTDGTLARDAILSTEALPAEGAAAWLQGRLLVSFTVGDMGPTAVSDPGWFGEPAWSQPLPPNVPPVTPAAPLESNGHVLLLQGGVLYGASPGQPFAPISGLGSVAEASTDACGQLVTLSMLPSDGGTILGLVARSWPSPSSVPIPVQKPDRSEIWGLLLAPSGMGVLWQEPVDGDPDTGSLMFAKLIWR